MERGHYHLVKTELNTYTELNLAVSTKKKHAYNILY